VEEGATPTPSGGEVVGLGRMQLQGTRTSEQAH